MEPTRYAKSLSQLFQKEQDRQSKAFQTLIHRLPHTQVDRSVYADWLQDRDLHHDEQTLAALRDPDLHAVHVRTLPSGKVWAGRDYTIHQIREHNQSVGSHWFDPDTMRFWNTRLNDDVFAGPAGVFFTTSDRGYGGGRVNTVRRYDPETAAIHTHSRDWASLRDAKKAAAEAAVAQPEKTDGPPH